LRFLHQLAQAVAMKQPAGVEILGWASSLILLLTLGRQIYKQWQEGSSEGVSVALFIGQTAASLGFTVYSFLIHNWVFVITNALMLLNGLAGLGITIYQHRRGNSRGKSKP
jgi:uncharacterized protein with PQ loop repeat